MFTDINGLEIRRGCVLSSERYGGSRRVDFIGKNHFIAARGKNFIEEALKCEEPGCRWSQEEVKENKFTVVQYRPLGIFYNTGEEAHDQDWIQVEEKQFQVFDAIKTLNRYGNDIILFEDYGDVDGWKGRCIKNVKFLRRGTEVKQDPCAEAIKTLEQHGRIKDGKIIV